MTYLRVLSSGTFTVLQDAGRTQWQHMGVPVSGPMDVFAFALANALVANPVGEGALELTLVGGCYQVLEGDCRVAVTGNFPCAINHMPVPAWQAHTLRSGDVLAIGAAKNGLRGYLAVAGGFAIQAQLGSVSTLVRAHLGGFAGRALAKGDRLLLRNSHTTHQPCLRLATGVRPADFYWYWGGSVRIVAGPQTFSDTVFQQFCTATYRVSTQADRMGYRLEGHKIVHDGVSDIVSEAIAAGSIQVPGDGYAIIALCDRQTTGGYPKIATVIRADLPRVGQMRPGTALSFQQVSVDNAQAYWHRSLEILQNTIKTLQPIGRT